MSESLKAQRERAARELHSNSDLMTIASIDVLIRDLQRRAMEAITIDDAGPLNDVVIDRLLDEDDRTREKLYAALGEIERLQGDNDIFHRQLTEQIALVVQLRAENERLHEELRKARDITKAEIEEIRRG